MLKDMEYSNLVKLDVNRFGLLATVLKPQLDFKVNSFKDDVISKDILSEAYKGILEDIYEDSGIANFIVHFNEFDEMKSVVEENTSFSTRSAFKNVTLEVVEFNISNDIKK